ncbi:MAG: tRNA-processing RNAse [Rhodocyclaceae bacterium]|nr:tRNA-processing RNAse [Rhodocyclaceae bacterium]
MRSPSRSHSRSRPGVVRTIIRRFHIENMGQTSAALAFTTLLALVPLVTLVAAVAHSVPFFDIPIRRLDAVLVQTLLPTGAGGTIAGYVGLFAQQARKLTVPGIAMLGVTAFLLMHTIERTFNHLWHVQPRPLLARLKLYAFVMAVWPFMLGAIAALISYAVTISLGFVEEATWVRRFLLKSASMALLGLFFGFLYYAVPNVRVSRTAAAVGGAFASLAFVAMQKGFELYLGSFGTLKSVYGAFAAVPIFLIWLHLSWAVVLVGGLIAATAFRPARR